MSYFVQDRYNVGLEGIVSVVVYPDHDIMMMGLRCCNRKVEHIVLRRETEKLFEFGGGWPWYF
jgi:hypothetical protein